MEETGARVWAVMDWLLVGCHQRQVSVNWRKPVGAVVGITAFAAKEISILDRRQPWTLNW